MVLNPIKQSTSTDSLTGLNGACDTACHFCNEGEDIENHRKLIDSKLYSSCHCRYATHVDCWQDYMDKKTDKKYECPLCKTVIPSWKLKEVGFSLTTQEPKTGCDFYVYIILVCIIGLALFVGLLLGLSKH
jgi:hypothetical protein